MNETTSEAIRKALPKPSIIDLLLEKKKLVITVLLLLAVAAAGVFAWMQKTKADEEKAAMELAKAVPWIQAGDADRASRSLKAVIANYGGTHSGNMARIYLATIDFTLGKTDEALALYNDVDSGNKDLKASAIAGAAACNVQKKAFTAAAEGYEQASGTAETETLKAMYLNRAAESLVAAGKTGDAVKMLSRIVKEWPATSSAAVAQRTIWRLSGQGVQVPNP